MPRVAGVYVNRLKKGIKLQADPTVKYAMQDFGCLSTSLVFKTSAINHSAISPCKPANMIISDAEEVVNIYTLFFCRNWQSFLRMALSEGKAPLPHR